MWGGRNPDKTNAANNSVPILLANSVRLAVLGLRDAVSVPLPLSLYCIFCCLRDCDGVLPRERVHGRRTTNDDRTRSVSSDDDSPFASTRQDDSMPPKLNLQLQLDTASLRQASHPSGDGCGGGLNALDGLDASNTKGGNAINQNTINIDGEGNLQLIKSYQAIQFNNGGVNINHQRNAMTSPLTMGAQQHQQSYQLSERDVMFMETLGSGASGVVQKAFWYGRSEFVAVKKISILEREKRHQLMNDIKALCQIPDVAGLIRFHGAYHCADKGQVAVALEYMDGGSLADLCEKDGRVPQGMLATITERILQGLSYLHSKHTVHRDIKPVGFWCWCCRGQRGSLAHIHARSLTYTLAHTSLLPPPLRPTSCCPRRETPRCLTLASRRLSITRWPSATPSSARSRTCRQSGSTASRTPFLPISGRWDSPCWSAQRGHILTTRARGPWS